MLTSMTDWLGNLGWTAFAWALGALLMLNVASVALLLTRRDRELVQRYTALWLAANLLLVAIGVGVPAITAVARLTLMGIGAVVPDLGSVTG